MTRGWLRNRTNNGAFGGKIIKLNGGGSSSQPADSQVVNHPITVAIYPLVNIQKAIEHGHRNSGFSHEKWWIFPVHYVKLPEGISQNARVSHRTDGL